MNRFCYSRMIYGIERRSVKAKHIRTGLKKIIAERFENLMVINESRGFVRWDISGIHWINWLKLTYQFQRNRFMWQHNPEIVVTEWVNCTIAHKAVRLLSPRQVYREEGEDCLSEASFDLVFPTLDVWIEQLYRDSSIPVDVVMQRAKNSTPDCFWKDIETPSVPPLVVTLDQED